ncbi:MAG: hypothetical protein J6Q14_08100 [Oscillospiraceae bacterium]|nr:hypothetical protein [Oscillospiraceae bacterium]
MENKINYIVREVPAEWADLSYYFDDDGLTERGGDFCYNMFIVAPRNYRGFNDERYGDLQRQAESIIDGFSDVAERDHWQGYFSYKDVMTAFGIPYNSRKCHALKEWAKEADVAEPEDMAEYLTIVTGKKWESTGVCGYCQGDYVDVVCCTEVYHDCGQQYGEVWLGCAKEFTVNYLDEDGEEGDSVGGYIVADCQAWRDEDYKRLVCEWAEIPEAETELQMIDGSHTYTKYEYRTA